MSMKKSLISAILIINLGMCSLISAQQYNSDNYLVMPHGIGTIVLTTGERNVSFVTSLALIPKFEFAVAGYLFWDDQTTQSPQHFTTSLYAKYSVWVNKENNGGLAAFLGLGNSPSYYEQTQFVDLHKNYWTAIAFTLPLFNNKLSWDLFPGAIVDIDYGEDSEFMDDDEYYKDKDTNSDIESNIEYKTDKTEITKTGKHKKKRKDLAASSQEIDYYKSLLKKSGFKFDDDKYVQIKLESYIE